MNFLSLGYIGLFFGTFLTATVIPFPSDVIVVGAVELDYSLHLILIVATIGNFLGTLTNYWIGYKISKSAFADEQLAKKFKLTPQKISRWENRLNKWGIYLGFLAWVPIIGEPLIALMGFFRVKIFPLGSIIITGIALRYGILLCLYTL